MRDRATCTLLLSDQAPQSRLLRLHARPGRVWAAAPARDRQFLRSRGRRTVDVQARSLELLTYEPVARGHCNPIGCWQRGSLAPREKARPFGARPRMRCPAVRASAKAATLWSAFPRMPREASLKGRSLAGRSSLKCRRRCGRPAASSSPWRARPAHPGDAVTRGGCLTRSASREAGPRRGRPDTPPDGAYRNLPGHPTRSAIARRDIRTRPGCCRSACRRGSGAPGPTRRVAEPVSQGARMSLPPWRDARCAITPSSPCML